MATTSKALKRDPRQPGLTTADSLISELGAMHDAISRRAYEIFDGRGSTRGRDLDDWLEAERELTWAPAIRLSEKDGALRLEAALAGFEPGDLDVQLTSDDVLIRSEKVQDEAGPAGDVYCSEFARGQLFRRVHLPQAVDPEKARAQFRNGLLSITLPLAGDSRPEKVPVTDS